MLERNQRSDKWGWGGEGQLLRAGGRVSRNSTVALQRRYLTARCTPAAASDEVNFGSSH